MFVAWETYSFCLCNFTHGISLKLEIKNHNNQLDFSCQIFFYLFQWWEKQEGRYIFIYRGASWLVERYCGQSFRVKVTVKSKYTDINTQKTLWHIHINIGGTQYWELLSTVKPVLRGHLWDKEKWSSKTGHLLKGFNSYEIFHDRIRKMWCLNTGECLIDHIGRFECVSCYFMCYLLM